MFDGISDEVRPLCLDLGAGRHELPGFVPIDRERGGEIYPLDYPDGSIDEIRASHVLEHFSHREVSDVVRHWIQKLKPGGRLRIAVPDFERVARDYLDGKAIAVQDYVHGSHSDENDFHKCAFDAEVLTELFLALGLERVHRWESELEDCASLPISLNLGAYKPSGEANVCTGVTAVLSAPRYGPVSHFRYAHKAFLRAGIPYQISGGAYWHQTLSDLIEKHIALQDTRYVLTVDYDSVFTADDVMELYRLAEAQPDADAICALQSKRGADSALFGLRDENGNHITSTPNYQLTRYLFPITTGHFGLTLFRADSLRTHARPWMQPVPAIDGTWGDGRVDADIEFWLRWRAAGKRLYLAPRVVIGHLQEVVTWPDQELKPIHQSLGDYDSTGMPKDARR